MFFIHDWYARWKRRILFICFHFKTFKHFMKRNITHIYRNPRNGWWTDLPVAKILTHNRVTILIQYHTQSRYNPNTIPHTIALRVGNTWCHPCTHPTELLPYGVTSVAKPVYTGIEKWVMKWVTGYKIPPYNRNTILTNTYNDTHTPITFIHTYTRYLHLNRG